MLWKTKKQADKELKYIDEQAKIDIDSGKFKFIKINRWIRKIGNKTFYENERTDQTVDGDINKTTIFETHGWWEVGGKNMDEHYCIVCGFVPLKHEVFEYGEEPSYCPKCHAKMDND